uniref:Uncharacterized protein n=1 Tax=Caenorhabditis japonica TaxID=281687 RepID=A0A8R1J2M2_CAEJA
MSSRIRRRGALLRRRSTNRICDVSLARTTVDEDKNGKTQQFAVSLLEFEEFFEWVAGQQVYGPGDKNDTKKGVNLVKIGETKAEVGG